MDKEYKVKVTWQAMAQMKEIVQYISVELLSPEAADKLLDKMREAIAKLSVMPERYALIEEEPWKQEGEIWECRTRFVRLSILQGVKYLICSNTHDCQQARFAIIFQFRMLQFPDICLF